MISIFDMHKSRSLSVMTIWKLLENASSQVVDQLETRVIYVLKSDNGGGHGSPYHDSIDSRRMVESTTEILKPGNSFHRDVLNVINVIKIVLI